jgi:1-acyl-sn-glycerol-3-phosphate acyltransferase
MLLTRQEIENRLIEMTQQFLYETGLGNRKVNLDNSLQLHLGLSSLARLELFLEIEKHFDIQFSDQMLGEINTLRDISNMIDDGTSQKKEILYSKPKNEEHKINVEKAQTLVELLLLYAEQELNRKHIYFQDEHYNEVIITYGELLEHAMIVAQSLLDKKIQPGDHVVMMLPNHLSFFYTFFGILLVNCIPIPMEPLLRQEIYRPFVQQKLPILQKANPSLLVTFYEIKPFNRLVRDLIPGLKEIVTANALLSNQAEGLSLQSNENDIALIHYATNTFGEIKEIVLTHKNILSSIRSYGKKFQLTHHDIAVSWAPLYRNPGLIEMWLECFYYGIPLILMSPYAFLDRPERWLWAIHYSNATISGGDQFAYELCIKKITPAQIEGLNLSSWRLVLNMGEVSQNIWEQFDKKFSAYGFKQKSAFWAFTFLESPIETEKMLQLKYLAPQAYDLLEEKAKKKSCFFRGYSEAIFKNLIHYAGKLAKFIYTAYVALIFLIILPPAYLCAWIMTDKAYAKFLHYWARLLFILMFCPIKIDNKDELYKNQKVIFVANHTSYMDTLLFMAILPPETKIVAKQELATAPIISTVIRKLGHILVERMDFPEGVRKSVEKIENALEDNSVLIFPEGTFSYAPALRPFKLGAFKIACEKNIPIISIATQGVRRLLRDMHYLMRPVFIKVFISHPILPLGKEYQDFIQLRKESREFIAKNCGEPLLNLIVAGKAAAEVPLPSEE